ncbi:type I-E CRISPR-associated protein Cse2/CasB [Brooklawnia sp.]|uniref:type I-E CRISPR-associated protein Cse2/CasB n=1 Tax=Brooklawnia sp. TaxID=2699740 RepID=UPI00311DB3DA
MNYYWETHADNEGKWQPPPGADLSAMRTGLGREPGDVPAMWRMYRELTKDGRLTPALRAEHAALGLYGLHQQGQRYCVHKQDVSVASALKLLRSSDRFSTDAVDARFTRAVTSTDLDALTFHLRGLVSQLKSIERPAPFDYTMLLADLRNWQSPDRQSRIRRSWASKYFPLATASKEK